MPTATRTDWPWEEWRRCTVCASNVRLDPSVTTGDAPCPKCGSLSWASDRYPLKVGAVALVHWWGRTSTSGHVLAVAPAVHRASVLFTDCSHEAIVEAPEHRIHVTSAAHALPGPSRAACVACGAKSQFERWLAVRDELCSSCGAPPPSSPRVDSAGLMLDRRVELTHGDFAGATGIVERVSRTDAALIVNIGNFQGCVVRVIVMPPETKALGRSA